MKRSIVLVGIFLIAFCCMFKVAWALNPWVNVEPFALNKNDPFPYPIALSCNGEMMLGYLNKENSLENEYCKIAMTPTKDHPLRGSDTKIQIKPLDKMNLEVFIQEGYFEYKYIVNNGNIVSLKKTSN